MGGSKKSSWGVVTLTMGSPTTPAEVEPFLESVFGDPAIVQAPLGPLRPHLARLLARWRAPRARERYGLVGGSPLIPESQAQTRALAQALAAEGIPTALAATYLEPGIERALDDLMDRGARQILALPLFPQYSKATTGSALTRLGRATARRDLQVGAIQSYPTLPGLVDTLASRVQESLEVTGERPTAVLLTAHGLPERHVRGGDPYVAEIQATVDALRTRIPPSCPVALGYQSRLGPLKWVGPSIEEQVKRLASQGTGRLVVVPISFVSEHLETLYDLDLALKGLAWRAGISHYHRVAAVGSHPAFIQGLADLVRKHVEQSQ